jgi:hypothetical protein
MWMWMWMRLCLRSRVCAEHRSSTASEPTHKQTKKQIAQVKKPDGKNTKQPEGCLSPPVWFTGSFRNYTDAFNVTCTECDAGQYTAASTATACIKCAPGAPHVRSMRLADLSRVLGRRGEAGFDMAANWHPYHTFWYGCVAWCSCRLLQQQTRQRRVPKLRPARRLLCGVVWRNRVQEMPAEHAAIYIQPRARRKRQVVSVCSRSRTLIASIRTLIASIRTVIASIRTPTVSIRTVIASISTLISSISTDDCSSPTALYPAPRGIRDGTASRKSSLHF